MKKKSSVKSVLKKSLAILCVLLIGFAAAGCRKDTEEKPKPESAMSDDSSTLSNEPEKEKPTPGETEEPLPETMVVTPFENSPVSEINARWSKEFQLSERGELINFDNGDFVQVVAEYLPDESEDAPENKALQILRYKKKGELLWDKKFEDLIVWRIYVAHPLSDDSLLLLTDIDCNPVEKNDYVFESNGLLTKISPEGEIVWSRTLTHSYECFDLVFEMPNGELYTAGNFDCNDSLKTLSDRAEARWWRGDVNAATRIVLARWDREGKLLEYILPKHGLLNTDAEYMGTYNVCKAKYVEDVGFLVNFGTGMVCYDEKFKEKWVCKFEKVAATDKQLEEGYYQADSEFDLTENSARNWFYPPSIGGPDRLCEVSFSGKLITDRPYTDNEKEFLSPFLPDGRQIMSDSAGKMKTRVSFVKNGKTTEFDSFETGMGVLDVVPTLDGGFFVKYFFYGDEKFPDRYDIITKYSAEGQTEFQRVFSERDYAIALRCGAIAVQKGIAED